MTNHRLVGLTAALAAVITGGAAAQDLRSASAVRQRQGETELTVNIRFGAGEFTLARETGNVLFRGNVLFDPRYFSPVNRYSESEHLLEIGTRSRTDDLDNMDVKGQRLDLRLTPDVPVSVKMEFGAGKAHVDLGGLRLARAEVATGASESVIEFSRPTLHACRELSVKVGAAQFTADRLGNSNCAALDVSGAAGSLTLDFTGEWQLDEMSAEIKLGVGGLTLRFPEGLGVAISLNRFLASFDRAGFEKRGNTYMTTGFDRAPHRINIDLRAIVGDVSVEWVGR